MGVYVAYALLVLHVATGALQSEHSVSYTVVLVTGMSLLIGLHLIAAFKEARI
jgi:hypothetical protein